jgi:type IV pilus assembly protein PilV
MRAYATDRLRSAGFSLVEVMVALIIIGIGALGIAKMQAVSLANTGSSRSRALAAMEAASLAHAMHANRGYWSSATSLPGTVVISTSAGTAIANFSAASATLSTAYTAVSGTTCSTTGTYGGPTLSCYCAATIGSPPCGTSYVNMAASDLYDWGQSLASLLPSATATVTCNDNNSPVDCVISLVWIENAVAANSQEATAAAANTDTSQATTAAFQYVTYTLDVVP